MINQDLLNYIKSETLKGTPKTVIQSNLLSNGWSVNDITEVFSTMSSNVSPGNTPSIPKLSFPQEDVKPVVSHANFISTKKNM